jgi:hypothetical protein
LKHILNDLLGLYTRSEEISINLIPEFFLFCSGKKSALRFSVNKNDLVKIIALANKYNFHYDFVEFAVHADGNNWNTLLPIDSASDNTDNVVVITLGYKKTLIYDCLRAEKDFDFQKAGELLGYPKCCVNAYTEVDSFKENWVNYYYNKHPNTYQSYLNNRVSSIHGYGCFSGEFFPCSLQCSKTHEIASTSENLMKINGFQSLQHIFKMHSLSPLYFDDYGMITTSITNRFIRFK